MMMTPLPCRRCSEGGPQSNMNGMMNPISGWSGLERFSQSQLLDGCRIMLWGDAQGSLGGWGESEDGGLRENRIGVHHTLEIDSRRATSGEKF